MRKITETELRRALAAASAEEDERIESDAWRRTMQDGLLLESVDRAQQSLSGQTFPDSVDLIREDRER
jgi:hypothetical protein